MTVATAWPGSPWRVAATAAYCLAVLIVLDPGIGFVFGAWPPSPSHLPWRHISSGLLIVAAPMIGAAAAASLVAARFRGDMTVLKLLRRGGLILLILGLPFAILYARDSVLIYRNLPAPQRPSFVMLEIRMFLMLAIALAVTWMFGRAARVGSAPGPVAERATAD